MGHLSCNSTKRLRDTLTTQHHELSGPPSLLATPPGSPLPASTRKAFFSRASNRAGRCFPTDLVFTFYYYQHVLDLASYELHMPLHRRAQEGRLGSGSWSRAG